MHKTPQFSPNTHIFLWDLHDVILEKSLWSWFVNCMKFPRKAEIIRHLNMQIIKILVMFLLEKLHLTKKQMVSEELIKAAEKAHNTALIELTMQTCSSYTPIKKTVKILQELTNLGYTHHLGSNIGKTVFDDCKEKFPAIFKFFKEFTIPFESTELKMVKKPQPDFFISHLQKYHLKADQIIFIDDKLVNVQAAQALGMHAIHFKNARQLRKQLQLWNIIN